MATRRTLVLVLCVASHVGCVVTSLTRVCRNKAELLSLEVGDSCKLAWSQTKAVVRPTQNSVGYAWVQRTVDKDMMTKADAQTYMDEKGEIGVVLGPGGHAVYAMDGHHTISALDGSGFHNVMVSMTMVCDYSDDADEATFWSHLADDGFAYLYGHESPNSLPQPISYKEIPTQFEFNKKRTTFQDDRWRAMVGFSRKIRIGKDHKYEDRCMNRVCDTRTGGSIPFFEYRWAYFFAVSANTSAAWGNHSAFDAFRKAYGNLAATAAPFNADVKAWQAAAGLILPLCRSPATAAFVIPGSFAAFSGRLPGYHEGAGPIVPVKDPKCNAPTCPDGKQACKGAEAKDFDCFSLRGFCEAGRMLLCQNGTSCSEEYHEAHPKANPCISSVPVPVPVYISTPVL